MKNGNNLHVVKYIYSLIVLYLNARCIILLVNCNLECSLDFRENIFALPIIS